jgi:hypothetical protein
MDSNEDERKCPESKTYAPFDQYNNDDDNFETNNDESKKIILILGDGNFSFTSSIVKDVNYHNFIIFATDISDKLANTDKYLDELKNMDCYNKRLFIEISQNANVININQSWGLIFEKFIPNQKLRNPDIIQFNCPWHLDFENTTEELVSEFFRNGSNLLNVGGILKIGLVDKNNKYYEKYDFENTIIKYPNLVYQDYQPKLLELYPNYEHCSTTGNYIYGIENSAEHTFIKTYENNFY